MKKTLISIILALVLIFTVGCQTASSSAPLPEVDGNVVDQVEENFIIKDGASDYVIVKPAVSNEFVDFAAADLQFFLKEATGVELPITTDDKVTYTAESKFFSLGKTSFSEDKALDTDKTNVSGYVLKTIDKSIFINSIHGNGVIQGVYAFLDETLNYEYYASDEYYIDKATEVELPTLDILFNPAIPVVQATYLIQEKDKTYMRRMGVFSKYDIWHMIGSEGWTHNTFQWVDPAIYNNPLNEENYHPEWFSPDGRELCFTRDDGDNNDEMFQVILGKMKDFIKNGPNQMLISLCQNDTSAWCTCQKCAETKKYYNSNLAIMIKYANRLIIEIRNWMQEEGLEQEFKFGIFCYQETMDAPVVQDENGNWVATHPEAVGEPELMIKFAPLRMIMNRDFYASENKSFASLMKQLKAVCQNLGVWWYGTYFHTAFIPLNNFDALKPTLQFFKDQGVYWSFHESVATDGATSFQQLRIYLDAKLHKDPSLNTEELIKDFFNAYYKDAAQPMYEYLTSYRIRTNYNRDYLGMGGDVGNNYYAREDYFPFIQVKKWWDMTDGALACVEHYKNTDKELYNKLADRITRESLVPRYIILKSQYMYLEDDVVLAERKAFKTDATRLGLAKEGHSYLQDIYAGWGI